MFDQANLRLVVAGVAAACLFATIASVLSWKRPVGFAVGLGAPGTGLFLVQRIDLGEITPGALLATVVVSFLAARGGRQLGAGAAGDGPVVLTLLAASGSVWLGVPETGPAVATAGATIGIALLGRTREDGMVAGLVSACAGASLLGAAGDSVALVGGLSALAPLVALGVAGPRLATRRPARNRALFPAVAGLNGLAAARLVAVADTVPIGGVAVVTVLSVGAVLLVRRPALAT